jgi:hypothetical protein
VESGARASPALALQADDLRSDGKILVGGRTSEAADFALVRLLLGGIVDGGFGRGGLSELSVGPGPGKQASITGLAHEADVPKSGLYGRILAYGYTGSSHARARVWP